MKMNESVKVALSIIISFVIVSICIGLGIFFGPQVIGIVLSIVVATGFLAVIIYVLFFD